MWSSLKRLCTTKVVPKECQNSTKEDKMLLMRHYLKWSASTNHHSKLALPTKATNWPLKRSGQRSRFSWCTSWTWILPSSHRPLNIYFEFFEYKLWYLINLALQNQCAIKISIESHFWNTPPPWATFTNFNLIAQNESQRLRAKTKSPPILKSMF